ncbi:S8 family serine peptidase [Microbacterium sp. DT81.1]|uniref:S8 family peptidase n=1 Tax=Microbacterium sp. DT81.1 TaxID=3393413 RepID=UPI003CF745CF
MADSDEQAAPFPREFPGRPPETSDTTPPAEPAPQRPRRNVPPSPPPGDAEEAPPPPAGDFSLPGMPESVSLVPDSVITRPLAQRMAQSPAGRRIGVLIEVRSELAISTDEVMVLVLTMIGNVAKDAPKRRTRSYIFAALTAEEIRALVELDSGAASAATSPKGQMTKSAPRRYVHRIWPNFEVQATIHRSSLTTKADAAVRSFEATGEGIVWAVLDSGVNRKHEHFAEHGNLKGLENWHRNFLPGGDDGDALADANGHGTHVAGIIAGGRVGSAKNPIIAATWYRTEDGQTGVSDVRLTRIQGMAPKTRIVSCKVLDDDRIGDTESLITALEYIQDLNRGGREMNVHGVNLSLGYTFDPEWFATGLSPVCREVDRLVSQGVIVVVSAGNTGYGFASGTNGNDIPMAFGMTINDPGNAARAITVGSTSIKPHATGVSYFSSKGPTGDGRVKPDLVAPGERVVSAGTGKLLERARGMDTEASYVEDSGTSMSAPHVSGVAAGFLSIHREYIGRPDDVKRILMDAATDLGRDKHFQGRGLVDAMRAIQSV